MLYALLSLGARAHADNACPRQSGARAASKTQVRANGKVASGSCKRGKMGAVVALLQCSRSGGPRPSKPGAISQDQDRTKTGQCVAEMGGAAAVVGRSLAATWRSPKEAIM